MLLYRLNILILFPDLRVISESFSPKFSFLAITRKLREIEPMLLLRTK